MAAPWAKLHESLIRSISTLRFQALFAAMARERVDLAGFIDPAALLETLHAREGDPATKNRILTSLVLQARGGHSGIAVPMLMLALWPGLDAVQRRLVRGFRSEPDLLVSEISARVVQAVASLDLDRVTWIAATIVRNTERDILRTLKARRREPDRVPLDREHEGAPLLQAPSPLDLPPALDAETGASVIADRLRPLLGRDVDLVLAVALHDEPQREAAERAGIGHAAARKRYQRALAKLRDHFDRAA